MLVVDFGSSGPHGDPKGGLLMMGLERGGIEDTLNASGRNHNYPDLLWWWIVWSESRSFRTSIDNSGADGRAV